MTRNPACCSMDTHVDEVARMMLEHDCGEIPVCSGADIVGVVTDRDLTLRVLARDRDPKTLEVGEVMTSPAVTISADEKLSTAIEVMEVRQIRRLPVLDAQGKLVGMLCQADVAEKAGERKVGELVRAVSYPVQRIVA